MLAMIKNMHPYSPLGSLILILGSLLIGNSAGAQQAQNCNSIQQPRVGTFCYISVPLSFRRKEQEGCDVAQQFVERISPYAYFTGSAELDGSGHNVTGPNVSFVSGSGNIRYQQVVSDKISQLNETKNKLEGKAAGCAGPVCADIRNQIDSINRTITEFEDSRNLTIQMGKNEKAHVSVKGCVSCSARLPLGGSCIAYSAGAKWEGRVRIYQRFAKLPESILQTKTRNIIQTASGLLSDNSPTPTPTPAPTPNFSPTAGRNLLIANNCSLPITLAVNIVEPGNNWRTHGPWVIQPRAFNILSNKQGGAISTTQSLLALSALTSLPNGGSFGWSGAAHYPVDNQSFYMMPFYALDYNGSYLIQLNCPPPYS